MKKFPVWLDCDVSLVCSASDPLGIAFRAWKGLTEDAGNSDGVCDSVRGCVASPRAGFPFPFPFFPFVIFCFSVASSVSAACSRLAELRSSASSSVVTAGCDALYCASCCAAAAA